MLALKQLLGVLRRRDVRRWLAHAAQHAADEDVNRLHVDEIRGDRTAGYQPLLRCGMKALGDARRLVGFSLPASVAWRTSLMLRSTAAALFEQRRAAAVRVDHSFSLKAMLVLGEQGGAIGREEGRLPAAMPASAGPEQGGLRARAHSEPRHLPRSAARLAVQMLPVRSTWFQVRTSGRSGRGQWRHVDVVRGRSGRRCIRRWLGRGRWRRWCWTRWRRRKWRRRLRRRSIEHVRLCCRVW